MRRYGHPCQTLFGLFNSFFLSPPIRCSSHSLSVLISHSLSVYISRSFCLAFSPHPLAILISHRRSHHSEIQWPPRLATDHWPTLRGRGTPVWRNGGRKWKLPSTTATKAVWDVGLFDLVDVGLCRWWDCFVGLFDLVDVWCWMWVCLVWWMVCADLSGFFFYFLLRWRWWMCGSGCWWPSVLLWQWLLVAVVAAWWLGRG